MAAKKTNRPTTATTTEAKAITQTGAEPATQEIASERLYWNAEKTELLPQNDPDAITLAVTPGNPIPAIPAVDSLGVGVIAMATRGAQPDQIDTLTVDSDGNIESVSGEGEGSGGGTDTITPLAGTGLSGVGASGDS